MKVLILADQKRYERYYPGGPFADSLEKVYAGINDPVEVLLEKGRDADFIAADAIAPVPGELIKGMPNLKLIHSEGVAFNLIDLEAASERGVLVCNNAGVNAHAVAEQAVMLMLMTLRHAIRSHNQVLAGRQIEEKLSMMGRFLELGECRVGLIGFGNIAKETALLLHAFGCEVLYFARSRKDPETEGKYHASYASLDEILSSCDIVSIHVPVTPETTDLADTSFFEKMKDTAILINTARGEMVNNEALIRALTDGLIAGAGLDTVAPEPVPADHPLLHLPPEVQEKIVFASHIGGVSKTVFEESHKRIWKAFEDFANGKEPRCIVNKQQ